MIATSQDARLIEETSFRNAFDEAASTIHQSLPTLARQLRVLGQLALDHQLLYVVDGVHVFHTVLNAGAYTRPLFGFALHAVLWDTLGGIYLPVKKRLRLS